jgi:hypothetical protein
MPEKMKNERQKSIEEVGIRIREASAEDLPLIEEFLSRTDMDSLFTPALSDAARGITITERVQKKSREGVWITSVHNEKVVGCLAIVPAKFPTEPMPADPEHGINISEGVSFADWKIRKLMELSTVVTDRKLRDELNVKGVGAELLGKSKEWVKREGKGAWGFVTDSWVGGDMGGFIDVMNNKAYVPWRATHGDSTYPEAINSLMRIYSDPGKRGAEGPPTVVYGIPIEDRDWEFLISKQADIMRLEKRYGEIESTLRR